MKTDLLAPKPMTPAQAVDLVERSRANGRGDALLRRANLKSRGWYTTTRARCAARYAHLVRCDLSTAARVFGVTRKTVWYGWNALYGDEAWGP